MATLADAGVSVAPPRARSGVLTALPRALTIAMTAAAVLAPLSLIVYQSFLSAPFFDAIKHVGVDAYAFIFADADFWTALANSLLIAINYALAAKRAGDHEEATKFARRIREVTKDAENLRHILAEIES